MTAQRQRGFTLVEMVIATAILVLAMPAIYGIFESAVSRSQHDYKLQTGIAMARSLLARASLDENSETKGIAGDFSFQIESVTQQSPAGQAQFSVPTRMVTAHVRWREPSGPRSVDLATLALQPRKQP